MSRRVQTVGNTAARVLIRPLRVRTTTCSAASLLQPRLCFSTSRIIRRAFSRTPNYHLESASAKYNRPQHVNDLGRLVQASVNSGEISLVFENDQSGKTSATLPNLWFRDSCPCPSCVSESSGQKRFATCDIAQVPEVESCRILHEGSLEVVWAHDFMHGGSHTSIYPLDLLRRILVHQTLPEIYYPQRLFWDRATFENDIQSRTISYPDWMDGREAFANAFLALNQWGLIIVKNVPESDTSVQEIAQKIGALQSTFYGLTWDVISKPNAENVAYTNEFLCLHQDLMYVEPPPKIQLLHCLKNECPGGDSLFSDGLRAAWELKLREPSHYNLLEKTAVPFQYSRNGNFYRRSRSVITPSTRTQVRLSENLNVPNNIYWSPPFQGLFHPKPDKDHATKLCSQLPSWWTAAKAFRDSLESPKNMLQYRLQPGDCVIFDNLRVLHGRTEFDTSAGHRHLRGAYLDIQTVRSALTRLVKQGYIDLSGRPMSYTQERRQAQNLYQDSVGFEPDQL